MEIIMDKIEVEHEVVVWITREIPIETFIEYGGEPDYRTFEEDFRDEIEVKGLQDNGYRSVRLGGETFEYNYQDDKEMHGKVALLLGAMNDMSLDEIRRKLGMHS